MYSTVATRSTAHEDAIFGISWVSSGIVTTGNDETIKLWQPDDLLNPTVVVPAEDTGVIAIATAHNDNLTYTASTEGVIRAFDHTDKMKEVNKLVVAPGTSWSITVTPKLPDIVTACGMGGIVASYSLKDSQDGKVSEDRAYAIQSYSRPIPTEAFALYTTYSPQGDRLAVSYRDGTVALYDINVKLAVQEVSLGGTARRVRYSADENLLVFASDDGELKVFDIRAGACALALKGHRGAVTDAVFPAVLSEGAIPEQIVSAGFDGTCRVWDIRGTDSLHTFTVDTHPVWEITCTPSNTITRVSPDLDATRGIGSTGVSSRTTTNRVAVCTESGVLAILNCAER